LRKEEEQPEKKKGKKNRAHFKEAVKKMTKSKGELFESLREKERPSDIVGKNPREKKKEKK